MDTKKQKSNNASKATQRLNSEGQLKKKKKKKYGKLKVTWIQKRKKQTRPQIF